MEPLREVRGSRERSDWLRAPDSGGALVVVGTRSSRSGHCAARGSEPPVWVPIHGHSRTPHGTRVWSRADLAHERPCCFVFLGLTSLSSNTCTAGKQPTSLGTMTHGQVEA